MSLRSSPGRLRKFVGMLVDWSFLWFRYFVGFMEAFGPKVKFQGGL